MTEDMPVSVMFEWMAYHESDPFGEWRDDARAARICAVIANVNRGKNSPEIKISDFMPDFSHREAEMEPIRKAEQWQMFKSQMRAIAGAGLTQPDNAVIADPVPNR